MLTFNAFTLLVTTLICHWPPAFSYRRLNSGADRVEKIDLTPSQIIIVTSKNGPLESLSVEIDLVDVETGEKSSAYNLRGSMLLITRGRYTISFLKPGHWYGIAYRSSQLATMLSTMSSNNNFFAHWTLTGKQLPFPVKKNIQDALSEITFDCSNEEKKFDLSLSENQTEYSIDVELDNIIEIVERNENARKVVGKITPKYCQRICWKTRLIANVASFAFTTDSDKQCHALEPITAETTLRDYVSYDVENGNLTILTDYRNAAANDYAMVTIEVNELKTSKHSLVAKESFRTNSNAQEFVLPALKANNFYATTYNYTKTAPFHYSENRHFIIEVADRNKSFAENPPVGVQFSIANISGTRTPIAKLVMNPAFNISDIEVTTKGFCREDYGQNISMNRADSPHVLDLNLAQAICSHDRRRPFCDPSRNSSLKQKCSTNLCYSATLHFNGSTQTLQERCIDAATAFPIVITKQSPLVGISVFLLAFLCALKQ